jgi:hypothetical protein
MIQFCFHYICIFEQQIALQHQVGRVFCQGTQRVVVCEGSKYSKYEVCDKECQVFERRICGFLFYSQYNRLTILYKFFIAINFRILTPK